MRGRSETMTKAMYAFSGDPITYGHIDIVERAAKVFDTLVVGIGVNSDKSYLFSMEERTEMAKKALSHLPNVEVISFKGTLVDFAYENCIGSVVRGIRSSSDMDYEKNLDEANKSQKLGIETYLLFANPRLAKVSSSMVKAFQKEQGLISEYVPPYVKQCLEARISGQYIVGLTGEIGSGKSYVGNRLCELGAAKGLEVHNIELDDIGHQILGSLTEPAYVEVRAKLAEELGNDILMKDGFISRKVIGERVFGNQAELEKLNRIMETPLLVRTRREMYGKKGIILFNAALLAESDMSYLCNNNVILLEADKASQIRRLKERNLTAKQIERRLESQYCFEEKRQKIEAAIEKDNNGKLWIVDNSDSSNPKRLEFLLDEIVDELKVR
jgi:pantetheine-phosphate adenylyltransferase/dephospho-CoA kinase